MININWGKIHEKVWGHELWIVNNEHYCGKRLTIKKGYQCSLHYHKLKHETFLLLSGKVLMEIGKEQHVLPPGAIVTLEPGTLHRFTGLVASEIMEFSTQHFEEDSYREVSSRQLTPDDMDNIRATFGGEVFETY